jgi:hypothetical protein
MAKSKRKLINLGPGVYQTSLRSWKGFNDIIINHLIDLPHYVFRGHRRNDWKLEPTIVRKIKSRPNYRQLYPDHLKNFKYALRGRRSPNPAPWHHPYDVWALGQHNGLNTPLLDWTTAPYVALFFAFCDNKPDATLTRTVFCLNEKRVNELTEKLKQNPGTANDVIEFHRPLSDENPRLVNQAGLFSVSTGLSDDIESWVLKHWDPSDKKVGLLKINISNAERQACLKALNRMNINFASLFPDIYGAASHANLTLEIDKY